MNTTCNKHGCPQQAYITNGHVSLHQQSHKTIESEDAHANEGRQKRTYKEPMSSLGVFFYF